MSATLVGVAPSGECLRSKGRYGSCGQQVKLCDTLAIWPYLSALEVRFMTKRYINRCSSLHFTFIATAPDITFHPSVLHFPHTSPLHSFTLNSKLTFMVNLFHHRSLTIDISNWLLMLMEPFSVLLSLSVLSHVFGAVDKTSSLVFQRTVK